LHLLINIPGLPEIKSLCVALVTNTTIEVLDLDDNGIDEQGCSYVADMLKENYFITDLVKILCLYFINNTSKTLLI